MVLPYWPPQTPQTLKPLEPCQWFCHTGRWSSQLLKSGRWLDCGLWVLAALDALLELPLAGLWRTISLFLVVRNGPSGLFLAYRLLHVFLLVFHLSSGDVKPVAAHCPVINLSGRDIACDQATTMRACVLMLFLFFSYAFSFSFLFLNSLRTWTMSVRYGIPNVFLWISSLGRATQNRIARIA